MTGAPPSNIPGPPQRPRLSTMALWGFVVACTSLFVLGFLGIVGVFLGGRGLRDIRSGRVRGRGLAVAGIAVGTVAFIFYVANIFL